MAQKNPSITVHPKAPLPARRLWQVVASLLGVTPAKSRREISAGTIRVNRRVCSRPERVLEPGDRVEYVRTAPEPKVKLPKVKSIRLPRRLSVIFEDSHIIVADKPAGLLSVPAKKGDRKTMLALVERHLHNFDPEAKVFALQRLDRDVSGVMIFAKDEPTYLALRAQFETNKPERKYVAIVAGKVADDSGTFRSYLATGKHLARHSVKNPKHGELAITKYRVLRRLANETIVEVMLETGRRNQIRVQFAEAGHPVIGETRYQRLKAQRPGWDPTRVALHALTLRIMHPQTQRSMEFCSPWPAAFKEFLRRAKSADKKFKQ